MECIEQGAEAKVYAGKGTVVKHRFAKRYRITELDERLRKARTRKEAKVMERLQEAGVAVPLLRAVSERTMKLTMERVDGKQLRDVLTKQNCRRWLEEAGSMVGRMHEANIMHGDLTTSNMLAGKKLWFIDFGLSFSSAKTEDKAVDLHVLRETLKAKHPELAAKGFAAVLQGYAKTNKKSREVLLRLRTVESRGRYKGKKF